MPRPQTPLAKAALTGAGKNHPERFRARKQPELSGNGPGKPPSYLPAKAKTAWSTFVKELGWLVQEDRPLLEAAALARAQIMDGTPDLPASFFGNYRLLLSSLGATPVDRAKVSQKPAEDEDDPFAGFGRAQ